MIELKGKIQHKKLFGKVAKATPIQGAVTLLPLTVKPTGKNFTQTAADGYGYKQVFVEGEPNLSSENIKNGVTIYGVLGRHVCNVPKVFPVTVTPTGEDFTVEPEEGSDGFNKVTVSGDENLVPENIAEGVTIYGVTGAGLKLQTKAFVPTGQFMQEYPDEGYQGFDWVAIAGDENLIAENIRKDVTIYGVTGTAEGGGGATVTAINYADFDNGTFTATFEDGVTDEYTVDFDDSERPISVTRQDGSVVPVEWGEA